MKVKIKNLDHLNDILFYGCFGMARDSLVCVMNTNTLNKLTTDFAENFVKKYKYDNKKYTIYSMLKDPAFFAKNNGVHFAIGEWLEDGEVDIKL